MIVSNRMSDAYIATNRFGLGGPIDQAISADPRRWLQGQLDRFVPRPPIIAEQASSDDVADEVAAYFRMVQERERAQKQRPDAQGAADPNEVSDGKAAKASDADRSATREFNRVQRRSRYAEALNARVATAVASPTPFIDRLVHFWANHFSVSARNVRTYGLVGAFEFEAIRPNVLGRFADMLIAAERHPAMLVYLDQTGSVGPNSSVGERHTRRGRSPGLNENLAREILELHTLGVGGGYEQADVGELALAMTGWLVRGYNKPAIDRLMTTGDESVVFVDAIHEPGSRTVLGKSYPQQGAEQTEAMLADFAVHPSTARHIAIKLARHFAGDDPPESLTHRLEREFLESGGNLANVYKILIDSAECWTPSTVKFKSPWEWFVSSLRFIYPSAEQHDLDYAQLLDELGQPIWRAPSPAGYDDIAARWAGSDAILRRVEVASKMVGAMRTSLDTNAILAGNYGDNLASTVRNVVTTADSKGEALTLLLVTPESMRR